MQPNIIKNYNINVSGPMTDHARLSAIYEDVLPGKHFSNTSNTLGERLNLYNFIRSIFIKQHDGEDIDLEGSGSNSLMSYLKFMEINPYHSSHFTNNPYKSLPDDMLIYNSCYPIRYDKYSASVQCAPNSVGMNIRIYRMTIGEYDIKKNKCIKYNQYNLWREVAYYEYIREQILKRKICPNFVLMYGYYICEKCNIDFDKLSLLRGKQKPKENPLITINQKSSNIIQNNNTTNYLNIIPSHKSAVTIPTVTLESNPDAYVGKALVALTEAPNYNIYAWTSKSYKVEGNIRRMVNTGFHNSNVWFSVIFQMLVALYVLQIHKIAFRDFTLQDNVYIKDVSLHENITNYWKYIVDGVDYYIPNNGYVVLLDSNYKDVVTSSYTLGQSNKNKEFKIYSNIFNTDESNPISDDSINNMIYDSFVSAIDPNSFSKSFNHLGGNNLPEDVKDLLNKMYTEAKNNKASKDIGYYIFTYMRMFLNNRIGTLLKELEVKNVRKDDHKPFRSGEVIVYEISNDTYMFAVFLGSNGNQAKILASYSSTSAINRDIIEKNITTDQIYHYSTYEPIVQNYKPTEVDLSEENLLEIYTISKN